MTRTRESQQRCARAVAQVLTEESLPMSLTKSLHTVTAVANVARYVREMQGAKLNGTARDATVLTLTALAVLGYHINVATAMHEDETVRRCVDAVAKYLGE